MPRKLSGPSRARVSFRAAFMTQAPAPGLGMAPGSCISHTALPEAGWHRRCTSVAGFTLPPWPVATGMGSAHDSPGRGEPELPASAARSRHPSLNQPAHEERMLRAPSASPRPQLGNAARRHPPCLRSPSTPAVAGAPQPCLCPAPVCGRRASCMHDTFTCRSAKPQGPGRRVDATAAGPAAQQTPTAPSGEPPPHALLRTGWGCRPYPPPGRPRAGSRGGGRIWQVKALLPPVLGYFWPRISGEPCGFSA